MSEDVFRQTRKKINPEEFAKPEGNPLERIQQMQQAVAKEVGTEEPSTPRPDLPFQVSGNVPPQLRERLQQKGHEQKKKPTPDKKVNNLRATGSEELEAVLAKLADDHLWDEVELPSKGKFYDNVPGILHLRAMTGEEEQILATQRFVQKGVAIDMIFKKCIKEKIDTKVLLSIDRTYLLIYLRGISYTHEYNVEIKCPECRNKFPASINLSDIDVEYCPDEFDESNLTGTLPRSDLSYRYRLATGDDEQAVTSYRDARIKEYGEHSEDDTLLYRTSLLLENIEGVTDKKELLVLLKKLKIEDVAHLRNEVNEPPFGADTKIGEICPSCGNSFEIDLPLETNFFFPGKKKEPTLR